MAMAAVGSTCYRGATFGSLSLAAAPSSVPQRSAVSLRSSFGGLRLQTCVCSRNHMVALNRRRVEVLGSVQDVANFQPLSVSTRSAFLSGGLIRKCSRKGIAVASAVKSEPIEAVEGEVKLGGGNGGNNSGNGGGGGSGGGGEALGWISSALVFVFFGALVLYAAVLAPAQTPYRDQYFIEKLVGLRSNDGFVINTILFCEFYIMGLWPLVYCSLILPSARNKKGGVPAWPFLILSFAVGAFALLPYFGLWQPPPPKVTNEELQKFPLNFLENKLVAYGALLSGAALFVTAALAGADQWTEFYQYVRESKFIHVMSIDFLTLSSLAPFWVYNDMATRRWLDKGSWLLPLSLVPYFGPALYLILRPPLPLSMVADDPKP